MKKNLLISLLVSAVAISPLLAWGQGTRQPAQRPARTAAAADPARMLPASDAIVLVDVRRTLDEAIPLIFSGDPARLAEINTEIANFKTKTGLDARSFERVAVGMRYASPRPGVTTADTVAVIRGTFDSGAMIAAGKIAANGRYEEQKYNGATIHLFMLDEKMKMLGLFNTRISQLAVTRLDDHTLALGDLTMVKAALDAQKSGARNADLLTSAVLGPNTFLSFSGTVPANIAASIPMANDEITKNVNSVRQVYGSVGVNGTQMEMLAAAKTHNPEEAQSLNDTLTALKQFGGMLAGQLPVDIRQLAQNSLENLKIEHSGADVILRLNLQQADLASLVKTLGKKKA